MNKVFITGLAGFIGFHTAKKFCAEGWEVFGIDNFNDVVYEKTIKYERAEILRCEYGIDVPNIDINDMHGLSKKLRETSPQLVIHLAAHPGVRASIDKETQYNINNIIGTTTLIKALERNKIHNVIYASSSSVMSGHKTPWKEELHLGPHLNPYAYTKAVNESQFRMCSIKNAVGLRFFTVYGPWGRPDMALYSFTKAIANNQPIVMYSPDKMKRDFTYIDDIVNGIWLVANNMTPRDIYCLGSGRQETLLDFVKEIEKNLNITAVKQFVEKPASDILETWSDITKIKTLGYTPSTTISQGIKEFVDWYVSYKLTDPDVVWRSS